MSDKIETIKKWIEKGDHDLGTAIVTHQQIPEYKYRLRSIAINAS